MASKLKVPVQKVYGKLRVRENGRAALFLAPDGDEESALYLRYAVVEMGTEKPVFPAVVLDDWGNEIKGLRLYRWLLEEGDRFPRAEVFGFDAGWKETQRFLRDLELYFAYPCWAYTERDASLSEGVRLQAVLIADPEAAAPRKTTPVAVQALPAAPAVKFPLTHAKVTWWHLPPERRPDFDF